MKKVKILGYPVDLLNKDESLNWFVRNSTVEEEMKIVVTAYSEFFVKAQEDKEFAKIICDANLVTPDGISVLMAADFLAESKNTDLVNKVVIGVKTIVKALSGKYETVTGVWLFENMMKFAWQNKKRVFLLGGWGNVSERVAKALLTQYKGLEIQFDAGEQVVGTNAKVNDMVVKKINAFKPNILCVAYNPVVQEKWMYKNKKILKAGVGIGLGGTFNEFLGDFPRAPKWMEKSGLKWLWRVMVEPKRLPRIFRAVFVFPWMIVTRIEEA